MPDWQGASNQEEAHYGWSVAGAGDVNGDGYADIVVGAPDWNVEFVDNFGKVWVHHGSNSGLPTSATWTDNGASGGDRFGYSVRPRVTSTAMVMRSHRRRTRLDEW